MQHFHHSGQVTLLLKFSRIDIYQSEQFIRIHQVEIPGQRQVPGWDGMLFNKGVTKFNIILTLGAVA